MEINKLLGNTARFYLIEPCTWVLEFSNGAKISNFSMCRIIKNKQLLACNKDHGNWFGLSKPYDAENEFNAFIENGLVMEISSGISGIDLQFLLNTGIIIEILSTSIGYEAWEFFGEDGQLCIATGSGHINNF